MIYIHASQESKIHDESQRQLEAPNSTSKYASWLLLFAAQVASVGCSAVAAYLESSEHVSPIQILDIRMLVTIGLCFLWDWQSNVPTEAWNALESTGTRKLLGIRCVAGTVSAISFYYALLYLELPQVVTVYLLCPLIAYLLSSVMKGSEVEVFSCLRVAMAMVGAGLIVSQTSVTQREESPDSDAYTRIPGFLIAVAGATANSIVYVSLQAIGHSIELRCLVKWFAVFVAIIASIMPFAISNPSFQIRTNLSPKAWLLNFPVAILGFLMEVLTAGGFRGNKSVDAAQITYIQPLLALILEWVFRGSRPTYLAILGSLIVLGSAAMTVRLAGHKQKQVSANFDEANNRSALSA